jgi:threonine/homoserine/homoserine lactone efflux protein
MFPIFRAASLSERREKKSQVSAAGGRAEGLASCVGTGLGGTLHVCAAALGLSLIVMGTICVVLNTLVDLGAVMGASRFLKCESSARRRAHMLNKVSGVALVGLGLYVAAARRGA